MNCAEAAALGDLAMLDHAKSCIACKGVLYRAGKWKAGCQDQALGQRASQSLDELGSHPELLAHVESCAACAAEVDDFRAFCSDWRSA